MNRLNDVHARGAGPRKSANRPGQRGPDQLIVSSALLPGYQPPGKVSPKANHANLEMADTVLKSLGGRPRPGAGP
jgi:hypothetical protein